MVGLRVIRSAVLLAALVGAGLALAEGRIEGFEPATLNGVEPAGPVTASGLQPYRFERGHEWPALRFFAPRPLDWRRAGALAVEVRNEGDVAVRLLLRVDDDIAATGDERSLSGVTELQPNAHATLLLQLDAKRPAGMIGPPPANLAQRPGDQIVQELSGAVHLGHITTLFISGFRSDQDHVILVGPPTLRDAEPTRPKRPLADAFGQWTGANWPGKVGSLADLRAKLRQAEAAVRRLPPIAVADRFGGVEGRPALRSTGYFRVQKTGGRWAFVTPDGHRFFSLGVDAVAPQVVTTVAGRLELFESLPPQALGSETYDFGIANLERGLGPDWRRRWPSQALDRLRAWGFNTLGNWSDPIVADLGRMAHVAYYDVQGGSAAVPMTERRSLPDPFDPRFPEVVDRMADQMTAAYRADPWLLGYFSGNELPWSVDGRPETGIAAHVLALGRDSPAKQAFLGALRSRYGGVAAWSASWGANLARSWDEALATPLVLPGAVTPALEQDIETFEARFVDGYFRTVATAFRAHDPHHLYLGARFGSSTPAAVAACARWCDVLSFNVYGATPEVRAAEWRGFDKPVLIGEFHFGSVDRGMFWTGIASAGSEEGRGPAYAAYVEAAVADPQIVGTHWFQYLDEALTGRPYDGENAHIGLVAVTDLPYAGLVEAAAATNRRILARFAAGGLADLRGTQTP